MFIGSVPMLAYDFCVDGIYYNITSETDRTVEVTFGDQKYTGAVVIPSVVMYDGYTVSAIGSLAFYGCSGLTSITIPNSVTSIGNDAFRGCSGLTSITIPNSVTSIGNDAFRGCSGLTAITIPNSVTSIGAHAFRGCSGLTAIVVEEGNEYYDSRNNCNAIIETETNTLVIGCKNTIIPNSVTSIGDGAFYKCSSLTSITIPNSVTSIGDGAFYGCTSLKTVFNLSDLSISPGSTNNGYVGYYASEVINAEVIDDYVFIVDGSNRELVGYIGDDTDLVIPEGITSIGEEAFYGNEDIKSVIIPSSVTSIGNKAFYGCTSLKTVVNLSDRYISKYSTSNGYVGYYASKVIDADMVIDDYVFTVDGSNRELVGYIGDDTDLVIPEGTTSIGLDAFYGSSLTSVEIPNSVTSIGVNAFYGCESLESITIPSSVIKIAEGAFGRCDGLTSVTLPEGLKSISARTFVYCDGLESITIPSSVTEIGEKAFDDCSSLSAVILPEGLKTIGDKAFCYCESLKTITIPSSVTEIGEFAFSGCLSLSEFKVASGSTSFAAKEGVLYNKDMSKLLAAPGAVSGHFEVPQGVTSIGAGAFMETQITSVALPRGLKTVGCCAFEECELLESVTFSKGLTTIEEGAFYGCALLTSVTLPEGLLLIDTDAFSYCESLLEITLPSTLLQIGQEVFYRDDRLLKVTSYATIPPVIDMAEFPTFDSTRVSSILLYVPTGCRDAYANDSQWGKFTRIYDTVAPLPEDIPVTSVTLNITELTMTMDESRKITATVAPSDATDATLTWTSSNESVATVVNGTVTAVGEGSATITATANDGSGVSATCAVTVTASSVVEPEPEPGDDETNYDNTMFISDAEAHTGKQVTLSLNLTNADAISDYQCDLYLPEGFSVAMDEDGFEMIYLSDERTNNRKHNYTYSVLGNGALRIVCYANEEYMFSGNEGEVLTITLDVAENLEDGEYTLYLKNIEMAENDMTKHVVPQTTSVINVKSWTLGDINRDGYISVTDVRGVVNLVLAAKTPEDDPAADINDDGYISVTDVRGVVNMVLYPEEMTTAVFTSKMRATTTSENLLYIEPFAIKPGEEREVKVMLNNPSSTFSEIQFNLSLPQGVELVQDDSGYLIDLGSRTNYRKHNMPIGVLHPDNSIRVVCYSNGNYTFSGQSGDVLILTLKASDDLAAGVYTVDLKDIWLTELDMNDERHELSSTSVLVGDGGDNNIALKGYFSTDAMNEISTAMADATNVAIVDLTEAVYVEPSGVMSTGNANTLFLLQEGMSMGNDANVVVGNVCENLELADAQAFHAPFNFTAETMTFARNFAQATIATFVLPMEVPVASVNGRVYKVGDVEGNVLKLEEITHGNLEAHQPYIVEVAEAGELLTGSLNDVTIVSGTEQPNYAVDGILHVGTYQRQEVASDAYNTYYGFTGGEFVKANTGVLKPFRTMICVPGASATNCYKLGFGDEVTAIDILDIELQGLDVYDLSGRKVAKPNKGVYIINGKKVYVK